VRESSLVNIQYLGFTYLFEANADTVVNNRKKIAGSSGSNNSTGKRIVPYSTIFS